jgi:hypothetical protein
MKSSLHMVWMVVIFCFGAIVPRADADSIPPQPVDGKIHWVYNYAEGQKLARANHKPLFVVFRCER